MGIVIWDGPFASAEVTVLGAGRAYVQPGKQIEVPDTAIPGLMSGDEEWWNIASNPFNENSVFAQDATRLARASEAEVTANHYSEKLANQLYYGIKAQEGKFFGYSGLGYGGSTEGGQTVLDWKSFTQATYIVPAAQPRVKAWLVEGSAPEETVRAPGSNQNLQGSFEAVPLPTPALIPNAGQIWPEGTDKEVIIWCPQTDELWEMWRLSKFATGPHVGEYKFGFGAYFPNVSRQSGIVKPNNGLLFPKEGWGARASGLAAIGGNFSMTDLIRVFRGGSIGHALGVAIGVTKGPAGGAHLSPGTRNDTQNNTHEFLADGKTANPAFGTVDAVPEGAWFAFPTASKASEFVNAVTEPLAAAIYEAIREHGLFVWDTSTNCAFTFNDARVLGTPYAGLDINPFAGWEGAEPKVATVNELVNTFIPASWTDPTLPPIKESFLGTKSVFAKFPWRTLEQLAPRTS